MASIVKRFLRSPKVITTELSVLSAVALVAAFVPQSPDEEAWRAFAGRSPGLASALRAMRLDAVGTSPWFLAIVLLAGLSLSIALTEQWQRFAREWRERPGLAQFRRAPFTAEFVRESGERRAEPSARIVTTGRWGLLGSPLFHSGLMLILLAGLLRLMFFQQALATLVEGETLPAEPSAYSAQYGAWLARPFAFPAPLRLEAVKPETYESGSLKGLSADVQVLAGRQWRPERMAINAPLVMGFDTLYLTGNFGPTALCEWTTEEGAVSRRAILLRGLGSEAPEARVGKDILPGGFEARVRAYVSREGPSPGRLEVRILREGSLLFNDHLGPGQAARLVSKERFAVLGVSSWAEFRGTRDVSRWPAYAGFILAALGATLIFTVVRVDEGVFVTPEGAAERVFVALRARRFAPLFAERFERLVAREKARRPVVE